MERSCRPLLPAGVVLLGVWPLMARMAFAVMFTLYAISMPLIVMQVFPFSCATRIRSFQYPSALTSASRSFAFIVQRDRRDETAEDEPRKFRLTTLRVFPLGRTERQCLADFLAIRSDRLWRVKAHVQTRDFHFALGELSVGGSQLSKGKFDDFVVMSALAAAKKYLRQGSNARPFTEIVDRIKAGGAKVDNEDELATGLSRSTLDIVKIGEAYGLLEHDPNIKRGNKKRKAANESSETEPGSATASVGDDAKNAWGSLNALRFFAFGVLVS